MCDIQRIADKVEHVATIFEMSAADRDPEHDDIQADIERRAYQDCADFLRRNVGAMLPKPVCPE